MLLKQLTQHRAFVLGIFQVASWYNGVPHVFIVTLCDISPGHELLLDYGEQHRTQMAEAYARCKSILVRNHHLNWQHPAPLLEQM